MIAWQRAGTVHSPVQLNNGKFVDRDGRLFSERQSKEMWSRQTILPTIDPPTPLAGLKTDFAELGDWMLSSTHSSPDCFSINSPAPTWA